MTIREQTEAIEAQMLSPRASLARDSRGREVPEEPCGLRTVYQRDRDRIIHCKSFRRLKHKTQVFLSPEGDHYRTRLTHTLEVAQIARTIARALRLNEDLTEAIALGHDLGHTPFGHAGERALAKLVPGGFRHHEQSLRVVEHLEKEGRGLNLTWEVRNGIVCHTTGAPDAATLEGRIVRVADKIAYLNHDIDDAVRAGVLEESEVPFDIQYTLGRTKTARITSLVASVIENSSDDIRMDATIYDAFDKLRAFMFDTVYTNPIAKGEESKVDGLIGGLYRHFTRYPETLPGEYHSILEKEGAEQAACDYISGMSDRYAINVFGELYIPKPWADL